MIVDDRHIPYLHCILDDPRHRSPDHSRLIRLDDAPVILGRRTRSGKEFKDPPPPPPSRRKSVVEKPIEEQPPRKERPRPKPTRKAKKPEAPTGEKSKQQSAWQEAQRRAANGGGTDGASTSTPVVEPDAGTPTKQEVAEEKAVEQELSAEKSVEVQPSVEDTDGELSIAAIFARVGQSLPNEEPSPPTSSPTPIPPLVQVAEKSVPRKSSKPESKSPAPSAPVVSFTSPAPSVAVLKLTRSDTVITATAGRPDDPSGKDLAHRKSVAGPKPGASKPSTSATNERGRDSHPATARASKPSSAALKEPAATEDSTQVPTPKSAVPMSKSVPAISKNSTTVANKSPANETSAREEVSVSLPKASSIAKDKATSLKGALKPTLTKSPSIGQTEKSTPSSQSNLRKDAFASWLPKAKRPQPKPAPSGTNGTGETSTASSSKPDDVIRKSAVIAGMSGNRAILGKGAVPMMKRKDPPEQLSGADMKKRKLVRRVPSSSDESSELLALSSESRGFTVNPFDRRAKKMELTRKGVEGESLRIEMKKWVESKRKEWKQKEKEKSSGEGEKSGSDAKSAGARTIVDALKSSKGDESAPGAIDHTSSKSAKGGKEPWYSSHNGSKAKDSSSAIRDPPKPPKDPSQSDNPGSSPKAHSTSQLVWNRDLGMDVAKVSVTGPGEAKPKLKKKLLDRREGDSTERRTSTNGSSVVLGSSAFFASRKPKPRVAP